VAAAILARGPHAESGRRACLGLVRLGEQHGSERLEAACGRALAIGNPTYKSVKAILKSGLDRARLVEEVEPQRVTHENIRGGDYFDREEGRQVASHETIEARYLEEERYSIMNEPNPEAHRQARRSGRFEARQDASIQDAVSAPRVAVTEPLPALLDRLQRIWARPRSMVRIGRREADDKGVTMRHWSKVPARLARASVSVLTMERRLASEEGRCNDIRCTGRRCAGLRRKR